MDVIVPIIVTNIAAIFIIGVSTFGGRGDSNRHLYFATSSPPTAAKDGDVVLEDGRTTSMARVDNARQALLLDVPNAAPNDAFGSSSASAFGSSTASAFGSSSFASLSGNNVAAAPSSAAVDSTLIRDTTPYFGSTQQDQRPSLSTSW